MAGKAKKRERPNLTAKFCESVQPLDQIVEYYDGSSSLVLRVLPNGKKNWSMRYRSPNGKQRRFDFGEFPALTLADARTEFLEAKLLIKRGGDPAEQRREEKVAKAKKIDTLTVAELGARYLQAAEDGCHKAKVRRRKKQSSIDDERYWFDRFILPRLGKYRVDELMDVSRLAACSGDMLLPIRSATFGVSATTSPVLLFRLRTEVPASMFWSTGVGVKSPMSSGLNLPDFETWPKTVWPSALRPQTGLRPHSSGSASAGPTGGMIQSPVS